eukprot:jgi/Mesvir1/14107/Mv20242-RA.1
MNKCRKEKAAITNSDKALLGVLLSGMKQGWSASLDGEGNVVFEVPEDDEMPHTDVCMNQHFVGGGEQFDTDHDGIFDLIAHVMSSGLKPPAAAQGIDKVIQVGNRKLRLTVSVREED